MPRQTMSTMGIAGGFEWYAVQRPNGRLSRMIFGSQYRAAQHAMRAFKVDYWPVLRDRGFRVVGVTRLSDNSSAP